MTSAANLDDHLSLTCATCSQSRLVSRGTQVECIGLAAWWPELRWHSCAGCFTHPCWQSVRSSVCFLDQGHPGDCWAWQDTYGDVHQGVPPITDLGSRT